MNSLKIETVHRDWNDEESLVILARVGEETVGMAVASLDYKTNRTHLNHVWVRSDMRDRGIGRRVVSTALREAKSYGIVTATLNCAAGVAFNLYRALGFRAVALNESTNLYYMVNFLDTLGDEIGP